MLFLDQLMLFLDHVMMSSLDFCFQLMYPFKGRVLDLDIDVSIFKYAFVLDLEN